MRPETKRVSFNYNNINTMFIVREDRRARESLLLIVVPQEGRTASVVPIDIKPRLELVQIAPAKNFVPK